MKVVRAPVVEAWLAVPHKDTRLANTVRARFLRSVHVIEMMGTLAGDDVLKKVQGYEALWETTVGDRRVFSTIVGNTVLMAAVVAKKEQRLSAGQLQAIAGQVRRFAEAWREGDDSRSVR